MQHKLSIITINKNNKDGIEKTIKSVLGQTYRDYQFIVIDGVSTDGSIDIIKNYQNEISFWTSENDGGVYEALNKGISYSTGEYIICMNSGDTFYSDNTLEHIAPFLENFDIIYGKTLCEDKNQSYYLTPPHLLNFNYFLHSTINHQSVFIKKSLHNKYGNYSTKYRIVSDWFFILKALANPSTSYKFIDQTIARYEIGGISTTQVELRMKEREDILQENFSFFQNTCEFKNQKRQLNSNYIKKSLKLLIPHGLLLLYRSLKRKMKGYARS